MSKQAAALLLQGPGELQAELGLADAVEPTTTVNVPETAAAKSDQGRQSR